MDSPSPLMYISIVVLIGFSAFFSASETIISSFNRIRLKKQAQDGSPSAARALKIADSYDKAISTILIGNNIVNIGASTIATLVATALFGPSGALISTLTLTLLILIFGEIMPKTYGRRNADSLAPQIAGPLGMLMVVFAPLNALVVRFTSSLERDGEDETPTVTEEELIYFLDSIEEEGVIEEEERDLVQSALEFDEITIREIITPRVNVVALDVDGAPEDILDTILAEGYSRMPVYEQSVDNIIGILYTKDYLRHVIRGESVELREMISDPYFVHKGMKLSQLLTNLKSRKVNLAVVLDEYGGTLGIVTMEDMLEELVGEIWDEDDEIPEGLIRLGETRYEVTGEYDILDLFEELGYDDEDLESDHSTVGGWATHMMEHIPDVGEHFDYKDLRFGVLAMDGHRVARLSVEKYADEEGEPDLEGARQAGEK